MAGGTGFPQRPGSGMFGPAAYIPGALGQFNQYRQGPRMPMMQGPQNIPGTPYPVTQTPTYQAPMPGQSNFQSGKGVGRSVQANPGLNLMPPPQVLNPAMSSVDAARRRRGMFARYDD